MHPGVGLLDLYFTVAMAQLLGVRRLVGGGGGGGGGGRELLGEGDD